MFRRLFPIVFGLVGATLLASCTPANLPVQSQTQVTRPAAPVGAVVNVAQGAFAPSVVRIKAGQAVQWRWIPPLLPAQILSAGFKSPIQDHGSYFAVFSQPGVYKYHAGLSAIGHGKVIVSR